MSKLEKILNTKTCCCHETKISTLPTLRPYKNLQYIGFSKHLMLMLFWWKSYFKRSHNFFKSTKLV